MPRLLFLFLALTTLISAQSNRFYYELKFRPDTISAYEIKEYFIVDINPQSVKFYSLIDMKNDSINKNSSSDSEYQRTHFYHYTTRERNSPNSTHYLFAGNITAQMKSHDEMKWTILPETKTLGTIKLQAATTHFGGRQWTAWFAESIPIQEGPYKFRGLPGMILEIYDRKKHYHFTFLSNKKLEKEYDTSGFLETHFGEKPLSIDLQKYIKLKLIEYDDPFREMKNDMPTYTDEYGSEVAYNFQEMKLERQHELKADNNPIEKEFTVPYK